MSVSIVIGGMIGLGKTSVARLVGDALGSKVFYESVDDNPILPLFYTLSEEELLEQRIPFLLQLYFLKRRFKDIREALVDPNNVIDRSIYEDWYFCKVNHELGRISELEFQMYEGLLEEMMKEVESLPKKAPDLMVFLNASFETVIYRIGLRGRDFEQNQGLIDYYRTLWSGYEDWVRNHYKASEVLVIDMDRIDVVNSLDDANEVVEMVRQKLEEIKNAKTV